MQEASRDHTARYGAETRVDHAKRIAAHRVTDPTLIKDHAPEVDLAIVLDHVDVGLAAVHDVREVAQEDAPDQDVDVLAVDPAVLT